MSKTVSSSFKGYLPGTSFAMAKKVKNLNFTSSVSVEETGLYFFEVTDVANELAGYRPTPGSEGLSDDLIFVSGVGEARESSFQGAAGVLLSKMIVAMGVKHKGVFLASIRPSGVKIKFDPKVIVALGESSAQFVLATAAPFESLRGKVHSIDGAKVIVTYDPSVLVTNPALKKQAWEDLKIAMSELGLGPKN